MNTFALFGIFALIAGALATPTTKEVKSDFIPACGEKVGVTQEAYDKFDIFGDWTPKAKCYAECELETAGIWEDGHFTEGFKTVVEHVPEEFDPQTKLAAGMMHSCYDDVHSKGCEGAYEFAKCMRDTTVGLGLTFFTVAAVLVGAVAEAAAHH